MDRVGKGMNEAALLSFQLAEIGDAVRLILSGALFVFGVGIFVHATYFRGE